jgi:hypothetical protein
MSLIKDIFAPAKFLPVHVSHDGMELLEISLDTEKNDDTLFIEIGANVESTPEHIKKLLQKSFPNLLEQAIEEECEYISFYI